MKNKSVIAATLLLIVVLAIVFTGCGETADLTEISKKIEEMQGKIEGLEQENDGLGSQVSDLQSDVESLGERVKKLESSVNLINALDKRISALEAAGGDATQFEQLKTQVQNLQADLIANKASDDAIKAQATQMQLKLDEIYAAVGEDNTFGELLNTIQSDITALYGEVDRVLPFENGKEYEVKLNGIVYYTVSILIEYHNGKVQSAQDIIKCNGYNKNHWCGSVLIHNVLHQTIKEDYFFGMMYFISDKRWSVQRSYMGKANNCLPEPTEIKRGETARWYFDIVFHENDEYQKPMSSLDIRLGVQEILDMPVLYLENVWDGVQEPIAGEIT